MSEIKLSGTTVINNTGGAVTVDANQLQIGSTTVIDNNKKLSNLDIVPNSSFMFRNKIINGGMHIAQRGTSFDTVNLVGSTFPYNLDRFCTGRANVVHNGHCTISQITGGGQKHQITQASGSALDGSEYFTIRQHIEGFNCFDLAGKQATLSFKVKTNKAGNYGVSFYDGTGSATITPQSITVSTADASAENKVSYTKTFTMPSSITADNASRLQLDICLAAHNRAGQYYPTGETQVDLFDSTANYFEIYEIQLEEGTAATPFEHRPYGLEKSLCQRYFMKVDGRAIAYRRDDTLCSCFMTLPECMRLKQPVLKNITKGILSNMQNQPYGTINDNTIAAGGESEMIDRGFLYIEFYTNNSGHTFIPSWEGFNFDVDAEL